MQEKSRNIVKITYDLDNPPPLSEEEKQELEALATMGDSEIDYSDIPPVTDFSGFHRVAPRSSFVRVDGDILDWINTLGNDRQELVNTILRQAMLSAAKRPA